MGEGGNKASDGRFEGRGTASEKFYWRPVAPIWFDGNEGVVAGQCFTPDRWDTPVPAGATREQYVRMWLDLMGTCEQFLLAGLRREIGPEGDLRQAYRTWYAQQMDEHHRTMVHLMERFARGEEAHAS